jgi:hypothetical protein
LGGPGRSSPVILGPPMPEDLGAGIASPRLVRPGVPQACLDRHHAPASHGVDSRHRHLAGGLPRPLELTHLVKGEHYSHLMPHRRHHLQLHRQLRRHQFFLVRCHQLRRARRDCGEVTRAHSQRRCQGQVQGCHQAHRGLADDQRCRGTTPATQTTTFEFRDRSRRGRSHINNRKLHAHTERTPAGKTRGGPS